MNRYSSKKSGFSGTKIIILLILVAAGYFGFNWYDSSRYQYFLETPVDPLNNEDTSIIIKQGETVKDIAQKLKDYELILDQGAFERYVKQNDLDQTLYAGRYLLNQSLTIPEIVEKLSSKASSEVVVTIPEGYTIRKIDKKLADLGLITEGEFIQATKNFDAYEDYPFLEEEKIRNLTYPLEGFLFPDTYFVSSTNFDAENFMYRLLNTFNTKVVSKFKEKERENTLFETITMASIVEHEVNVDQDRPIVAGILWKRLKEDWQLGADATLLYLKKNREIDYNDLKENSPYNTRKFKGLPPGPIGNPSLKSIIATLEPEETPYYYYLHRADNGKIVYARTNEEHNRNREKYL